MLFPDPRPEDALQRFVRKTRELFARQPDPEKRWTTLTPILAELMADPAILGASKYWPESTREAAGRGENLLFYQDPDYGFVVNGLIKNGAPRSSAWVHDHAHIYTLYGVLDGRERIERYERTDDQSRPDHAELKRTADTLVGAGEIDLVRPYEIHSEVTVGERTVAVIIRSEENSAISHGRYNVVTNEYMDALGPRQTRYPMLPESAG